jgi:signal transduction histidine kinase
MDFENTLLTNDGYIVAVEDSLVQARKLKNFLDQRGLKNIVCGSAEEALPQIQDNPPKLIISDIIMPGMDGYTLCHTIKQDPALREIPVILLTSLSDPLDIIKGLQAGADNFITKPYEEEYLYSRIESLLLNREFQSCQDQGDAITILFKGEKYTISADKKQILNLLFSVYEAAVQRNHQLITTQQELQASNENLQSANQELEAFSYTVSHDLRSPLNVVAGYTQLLQAEYDEMMDEEGRDYLARILQSTFSMSHLIDDLLKFSRSGTKAITPESVDLSKMAEGVVREVRERYENFKADVRITAGIHVMADPALIHVVLDNLIGNAVKYSSKVDFPVVVLDKVNIGGEEVICISDNGAGFDMSKAEKMFNPFQRFHTSQEFQGTGVGLATVRRIVERHGGRIWAESERGKGAAFYFTLEA